MFSHAGSRGVWGHAPPPGKFFKIDAKILKFRGISTHIKCCLQILCYAATACVNGKISVNRHMGVQHKFIMADSFKRISGVWGLEDFFNLREIDAKNIKINKSNLYCTSSLD